MRGPTIAVLELIVLWSLLAFAFLVAAKAHGRQIRLLRELEGYDEIDFRRQVPNAPFVEALWRHDRIHYWSIAAGAFAAWLAITIPLGHRLDMSLPLSLALALPIAMTVAFTLRAVSSNRDLLHKLQTGPRADAPATARYEHAGWRSSARRGTWLWLGLTVVATVTLLVDLVARAMT